MFPLTAETLSAESVVRWLKARTRVEIRIERSKAALLAVLAVLLVVGAVFTKMAVENMDLLLPMIRNKKLWLWGSLAVYMISISGIIFDLIRSPPPFYCTRKGCMFFHPQSQQQFVVEGIIVGGFHLVMAYCIIKLNKRVRYGPAMTKHRYELMTCSAGFLFAFSILISLYRGKARWYPFRLLF